MGLALLPPRYRNGAGRKSWSGLLSSRPPASQGPPPGAGSSRGCLSSTCLVLTGRPAQRVLLVPTVCLSLSLSQSDTYWINFLYQVITVEVPSAGNPCEGDAARILWESYLHSQAHQDRKPPMCPQRMNGQRKHGLCAGWNATPPEPGTRKKPCCL